MPVPQRDHLLPKNATPLERALSAVAARMLDAPHHVIRDAWDADRCPVHLLPYLAQAWSVDEWDPAWTEAEKRQAIRDSIWIHKHKGTIGALRRALAQVKLAVSVAEWFEHDGAPYTFRLAVTLAAGAAWTRAEAERMLRVVISAKNVRSWIDVLKVAPAPVPMHVRAGVAIATRVITRPLLEPVDLITLPRAALRSAVVFRVRVATRPVLA